MPRIAGQPPPVTRHLQVGPSGSVGLGLAVHQRDYVSGEPLQALDALRNGLAAAIENQLVHADRRESSNVAGNVFRLAGESSAGSIRRCNPSVIERCFVGNRQRREIAPFGLGQLL